MTLGVDSNILLYSLNPASVWHVKAVAFLTQQFGAKERRVAITDYVLTELYVLLRTPTVMSHPLTARQARDLVISYWKIPDVLRLENAPIMDAVWALAGEKGFPVRRVFDARMALTMSHGGVTQIATANVKDFNGLGFERVWNPLIVDEAQK
jgi:predicted nucleic acid-binding protein